MSSKSGSGFFKAFFSPANRRRSVLLLLVTAVVVIGGASYGIYYLVHGRWYESTDDAYANGNIIQVSPQIAGTVVSIGADDNALVQAGQPLAGLDPADASVALEQAEANLARTVRQVRGLYTNVGSLEADLAARRSALDRARADFDRRQGLASTGAIPAEELAHAREALATAQSAVSAAEQQLATSHAMIENTGVLTHPEVKAAAAAVRRAYLDCTRTSLVAPVSGYVAQRSVQVGQRVQPGTPLMAVVPLDQVWVDANFKETQLQHMRIGQPVELTSDLYGSDVVFHGKIAGLGVGTGSAFSLLPAQNATGNWIKIVQRVPVRVVLDPKDIAAHPLRIGLSMQVEVNMHDRSGAMLAQAPVNKPVFTTDVFSRQLDEAESRIADVIRANVGGRETTPAARNINSQSQDRKIRS